MAKARSGGGITSNKLMQSTKWKQEPVANKASPAGAAQQGLAVQFPGGGGRTIYKSGSQSPTPPAREMPEGRNTLAEYGPDIPGRK